MKEKDILYVLEIAKCHSFKKASENLFIAQPALSRYIKQLEKRLGGLLFDRNTTPVSLTEMGELFVRYAEKIQLLSDEFHNECINIKNSSKMSVRIGGPLFVGDFVLSELIPYFLSNHPDIHIITNSGSSDEVISDFLSKRYDIIICARNFKSKDTVIEQLYMDEGVIAVNKDSEILSDTKTGNQRQKITPAELRNENFVYYDVAYLHRKTLKLFEDSNVHVKNEVNVSSLSSAYTLVAKGIGFTSVLKSMIVNKQFPEAENMRIMEIDGLPYPVYIAYEMTKYKNSSPVKLIVDYIKSISYNL